MLLKFFGPLADITGKSEIKITDIKDTNSLLKKMQDDFPKLKDSSFLIAVDQKIVNQNQPLQPGNEVAFLPPFAGG